MVVDHCSYHTVQKKDEELQFEKCELEDGYIGLCTYFKVYESSCEYASVRFHSVKQLPFEVRIAVWQEIAQMTLQNSQSIVFRHSQ